MESARIPRRSGTTCGDDRQPLATREYDHFDAWRLPQDWRAATQPDFQRFLRSNLDHAHGAAIPAETRVNADGTLDVTDWPRPQHDGPALRALTLMRWGAEGEAAPAEPGMEA